MLMCNIRFSTRPNIWSPEQLVIQSKMETNKEKNHINLLDPSCFFISSLLFFFYTVYLTSRQEVRKWCGFNSKVNRGLSFLSLFLHGGGVSFTFLRLFKWSIQAVCVRVCVSIHVCTYTCVYLYIFMYMCACVYVFVCIHVCMDGWMDG